MLGLINNVLYVISLSAALDLVGADVPKGVVLLVDVVPSFITKLTSPYFIHKIPYSLRIWIFTGLSCGGMLLVGFTPPNPSIAVKLVGVGVASISSGAGELSFLGLTHYYGKFGLAAWGSGTGGAGIVGAGLYVALTSWIGLSVKATILASAFLPMIMLISFFVILPRGPLRHANRSKDYTDLPTEDVDEISDAAASSSLLAPGPPAVASVHQSSAETSLLYHNLRRARSLFFPYMLPLLLVYIGEYTINQGVSPTLLFPLPSTPFKEFRDFYPFYNLLYQIGVFIARSSTPFIRIHHVYLPSFLQLLNLVILTTHALFNYIPSVYIVFIIVLWEGLLGGAVYVNTFAEILEKVPLEDREFSLGATSVSDSAGYDSFLFPAKYHLLT